LTTTEAVQIAAVDEAVGVAPEEAEEVLLQSYLFLGFPVALNALGLWRRRTGRPAPEPIRQTGMLAGGWRGAPALGSLSADGLQAQLDALEAGLPPLSSAAATIGGMESPLPLREAAVLSGLKLEKAPSDLKGDEALALFADVVAPTPTLGPTLTASPGLSPPAAQSPGLSPLSAISPNMLSPLGVPAALSLLSASGPQVGSDFLLPATDPPGADLASLGLDIAPLDAPPLSSSPYESADPLAVAPTPPSQLESPDNERVPPYPVSSKRQPLGSELAHASGAANPCEPLPPAMLLPPSAGFSEAGLPAAKRHCSSSRAEPTVPASNAVSL
jgi:hypothetical protein